MRLSKRAIWIAVLPSMHLILCALVGMSGGDAWYWIAISLIDLPLVFLHEAGKPYGIKVLTPLGVTVLGTLLWLCIAIAVAYFVQWLKRTIASYR